MKHAVYFRARPPLPNVLHVFIVHDLCLYGINVAFELGNPMVQSHGLFLARLTRRCQNEWSPFVKLVDQRTELGGGSQVKGRSGKCCCNVGLGAPLQPCAAKLAQLLGVSANTLQTLVGPGYWKGHIGPPFMTNQHSGKNPKLDPPHAPWARTW